MFETGVWEMKIRLAMVLNFAVISNVFAMPAEVILLRHGEKPEQGNILSEQGFARAKALPDFFKNNIFVNRIGPNVSIYAMRPSRADGSIRAIQTMEPTAKALSVPLHEDFSKIQIDGLVNEIKTNSNYNGHTVVVCWEHKMIPLIAKALGAATAPQQWNGAVFDRAWVLEFDSIRVRNFKDIPEHVLPSDSSE